MLHGRIDPELSAKLYGTPRLVVGLRGLAGAGKTSIGEALVNRFIEEGCSAIRYPVAYALKLGLLDMGVHKSHPLYRELAQSVGARLRAFNPDHWVDRLKLAIATSNKEVVVIDDIRYPNEAPVCTHLFYVKPVGFDTTDLGERADHESEQWNLAYPSHLPFYENTTTIENHHARLEETVNEIYEKLRS